MYYWKFPFYDCAIKNPISLLAMKFETFIKRMYKMHERLHKINWPWLLKN